MKDQSHLAKLDWSKPSAVLSRETGVDLARISFLRSVFAPETLRPHVAQDSIPRVVLSLRIKVGLKAQLTVLAKKLKVSRTALVEAAVEKYLESGHEV